MADIVDKVKRLGDLSIGGVKLIRLTQSAYAVGTLQRLMKDYEIDVAREFAANMLREGQSSPEFLKLVAEILAPTKKQPRGRPKKSHRKFETEICFHYWFYRNGGKLTPAEARKLVIEEFSKVVKERTVNQVITDYTRVFKEVAQKTGMEECQILPVGSVEWLKSIGYRPEAKTTSRGEIDDEEDFG